MGRGNMVVEVVRRGEVTSAVSSQAFLVQAPPPQKDFDMYCTVMSIYSSNRIVLPCQIAKEGKSRQDELPLPFRSPPLLRPSVSCSSSPRNGKGRFTKGR